MQARALVSMNLLLTHSIVLGVARNGGMDEEKGGEMIQSESRITPSHALAEQRGAAGGEAADDKGAVSAVGGAVAKHNRNINCNNKGSSISISQTSPTPRTSLRLYLVQPSLPSPPDRHTLDAICAPADLCHRPPRARLPLPQKGAGDGALDSQAASGLGSSANKPDQRWWRSFDSRTPHIPPPIADPFTRPSSLRFAR
ncbi:CSEP0253 putative effector protein [Blumeria hordei DH14]|uniref:CSEP0253 putative effector protein n=1 Tax=Blumeria graminis f. sp. hordei (strain DH14) TaxID=546991 RepID=N1JIT0_BLUG1|nr:CSEP0253 putative effector protein [Blumeria hordei DH14]